MFLAISITFSTVVSISSASASGCDDRRSIADNIKAAAVKIGSLSVDQLNIAHKQTDIEKRIVAAPAESKSAMMDESNTNTAESNRNAAEICHLMKEQDSELRAMIDIIDSDSGHCGVTDSNRDKLFASLKNNVNVRVSCGNNWQ
jgi:hypothetical protein